MNAEQGAILMIYEPRPDGSAYVRSWLIATGRIENVCAMLTMAGLITPVAESIVPDMAAMAQVTTPFVITNMQDGSE